MKTVKDALAEFLDSLRSIGDDAEADNAERIAATELLLDILLADSK